MKVKILLISEKQEMPEWFMELSKIWKLIERGMFYVKEAMG